MQFSLMIKGTASQIAAVLANLPPDMDALANEPLPFTPAPTIAAQAAGLPIAPAPFVPPMPVGQPADDGDNGPVNTNAPATDARGFPWDERIHASTKVTNADGSWRRKRGITDTEVAAVEAQLKANAAPPMPQIAPSPFVPPMPAPTPAPFVPPMPANPEPAPLALPMPAAAPVATAQAAGVADHASSGVTVAVDFGAFMQNIAAKAAQIGPDGQPLINVDYLARITAEISNAFAPAGYPQLTAITDISQYPDMVNYAVQLLQRDGRW